MGLGAGWSWGGIKLTSMEVSNPLVSERVAMLESHVLEEKKRVIQIKHVHPLRHYIIHV